MATKRKTAAEKRAEVEALRLEQLQLEEAEFRLTYQKRLLDLVHTFVSESVYSVEATGEGENKAFEFALSRHSSNWLPLDVNNKTRSVNHLREGMEQVERFVKFKREEQRLEREREVKKSAALAKLTKEERELLGV